MDESKIANNRNDIDWLPNLVTLEEYGGNWIEYNENIYSIFCSNFIDNPPVLNNKRVNVDRTIEDGKFKGFWHITSEKGEYERCKRIKWPRPLISNYSQHSSIFWWENERPKDRINLLILLRFIDPTEHDYLIVLKKCKQSYFLITAYPIEHKHQIKKYVREYKEFWNITE